MKGFISEMAGKYHLSEERMSALVSEVVAQIEKDLPLDVNMQIDEELRQTPIQVELNKASVFAMP